MYSLIIKNGISLTILRVEDSDILTYERVILNNLHKYDSKKLYHAHVWLGIMSNPKTNDDVGKQMFSNSLRKLVGGDYFPENDIIDNRRGAWSKYNIYSSDQKKLTNFNVIPKRIFTNNTDCKLYLCPDTQEV